MGAEYVNNLLQIPSLSLSVYIFDYKGSIILTKYILG